MHTIIEPFGVKMTEALPITTRGHREACLASALGRTAHPAYQNY
jgi:hypothetical protein